MAQDKAAAVEQFQRAAAQGHAGAKAELNRIGAGVGLKYKINNLLLGLENKIGGIEQHQWPAAHAKASELLMALNNTRDEFISNIANPAVDLKVAKTAFKQKCDAAINEALPILEKDLGWGDYLLNLLKKLGNVVSTVTTFGYRTNFFQLKVSESKSAAEDALTALNSLDSDKGGSLTP
ncbi:hypothetical protein LDG_6446 [Legionella drancourtii LLAP12]|uniref:Uncharacterized protein n=1 Tax=Legionella drancourtii LLAP12 TaxID=658187 RepID=G9EMH9_9GAMM|nr:hypothetical protein LDG_6446 [Legionella drancourtii LLAP12]